MSDPEAESLKYTTVINLDWLGPERPFPVRETLLVSGDRDIVPDEISSLKQTYGAVAADWESASIAWVTQKNHIRCLILRGVSDVVGPLGSETYGNPKIFERSADKTIATLLAQLPKWLELLQLPESMGDGEAN